MSTPHSPLRDGSVGSLELDELPPGPRRSTEQLLNLPSLLEDDQPPPIRALSPELQPKLCGSLITNAESEKDLTTNGNDSKLKVAGLEKRSCGLFPSGMYHWTLELCALGISVSALVAIIVLLPLFENKALSAWQLPMSFNTIISVLGATSRAALAFAISACISQGKWNWYNQRPDNVMVFDRFEEASRGPWGSLRLLWWTKLRHWTALGALSAVTLVGFEPFLQAIISLSGEEVEVVDASNTGSIGRVLRLDAGYYREAEDSPIQAILMPDPWKQYGIVGMDSNPDFGALAAVWEGFSDLSSINSLKPDFICRTGNCTWPVYASLAVCSDCNDISEFVEKSSGLVDVSDPILTKPHVNTSKTMYGMVGYTRYEIPALNISISNGNGKTLRRGSSFGDAKLTAQATLRPDRTISFRNLRTLIISFAMIEASQKYLQGEQGWEHNPVTSTECALYFCTNIYRSVVEQGVLREQILGSQSIRNLDSFIPPYMIEHSNCSKAYNEYMNYTLVNESDLDRSRYDLQLVISKEDYYSATEINEDDNLRFNISHNTIGSLGGWFLRDFSRRPGGSLKQLVYPVLGSDEIQPPVIESLGNSRNISETFEIVAASLTKWMRDRSLRTNMDSLVGTTKEWTIRMRVNWPFLSLPIGALLGGCVFCLLSILETRKLGLPAWRGSSLATLAHGLDMDSRALLREASDGDKISSHARGLDGIFVDSEGGKELVHGEKEARPDREAA